MTGHIRQYPLRAALSLAVALASTGAIAQDTGNELQEIVVTGSYLGSTDNLSSPVEVVDAERVNDVPRASLGDFFFSEVTQAIGLDANYDEGTEQGRNNTGARASGVDLRGLGKENTLTLIDGKRTIEFAAPDSDGWRNVDINAVIPRIALDRMEILLDGGSALYGTDAVAGVVNVIPRYDFEGIDVSVNSQHHEGDMGLENWTVSAIGGVGNGTTSLVAAFERHEQDHADVYDVGLDAYPSFAPSPTDDAYLDRIANGTYTWRALGVAGMGGGLGPTGPFLPDPLCGDADALGSPFLAGDPNLDTATVGRGMGAVTGPVCSTFAGRRGAYLQSEQERTTVFAALRHTFSDALELTIDASYATRKVYDIENEEQTTPAIGTDLVPYNVPVNHPGVLYNATIDPVNWSNPDGYQVLGAYTVGWMEQIRFLGNDSEMSRLGLTLDGALGAQWNWSLSATVARNDVYAARRRLDLTPQSNGEFKLANALNGLGGPGCDPLSGIPGQGGCEWFNPFMNAGVADAGALGLSNSSELLEWLRPNQYTDYEADFYQVQALLTGSLPLELAGGPIDLAVGLEQRKDELDADRDDILNAGDFDGQGYPNQVGQEDYSSTQKINAAFFELLLPFSDRFEAQIAGRYEDYDDSFDTFNPKIGLTWRASDALTLRGSFGTSFKAPTVIHTDVVQSRASFLNLCDVSVSTTCRPGGASLSAGTGVRLVIAQAGDPDIKPQESDNLSLGFDWDITDELSFGMDYVDIAFENLIDVPFASGVLRDPSCNAGTVIVDAATGPEPLFIPIDDSANNRCFELDDTFDPSNPALGGIRTVYLNPQNLTSVDVEAIDFRLTWTTRLGAGDLTIAPKGSYTLTWEEQNADGTETTDFAGYRTVLGPGIPEWKVNLPVSWRTEKHKLDATLRYLSGQEVVSGSLEPVPSWTQLDLGYAWNATDKLGLRLAVNNALDRNPGIRQATLPRYRRAYVLQFDYSFFGHGS